MIKEGELAFVAYNQANPEATMRELKEADFGPYLEKYCNGSPIEGKLQSRVPRKHISLVKTNGHSDDFKAKRARFENWITGRCTQADYAAVIKVDGVEKDEPVINDPKKEGYKKRESYLDIVDGVWNGSLTWAKISLGLMTYTDHKEAEQIRKEVEEGYRELETATEPEEKK